MREESWWLLVSRWSCSVAPGWVPAAWTCSSRALLKAEEQKGGEPLPAAAGGAEGNQAQVGDWLLQTDLGLPLTVLLETSRPCRYAGDGPLRAFYASEEKLKPERSGPCCWFLSELRLQVLDLRKVLDQLQSRCCRSTHGSSWALGGLLSCPRVPCHHRADL